MSKRIIYNNEYFWNLAKETVKNLPDNIIDFRCGSVTNVKYSIERTDKKEIFAMEGITELTKDEIIDKIDQIIAPDEIIEIDIKIKNGKFKLKAEWLC